MALQTTTIAKNIADLTLTYNNAEIPIRDIDAIPKEVTGRKAPIIIPNPDNFVSDINIVRDSQGGGAVAMQTVMYVLTYRLYYAKVGSGRAGSLDHYDDMIGACMAFYDLIVLNDDIEGAIDIRPGSIPEIGLVLDPAANEFHGADITILVKEFVN